MADGLSYADAPADAQRRGIAEADPRLPARLSDVDIEGIRRVTGDQLRAAAGAGTRIVLHCLADGVVYYTDPAPIRPPPR